MTHFFFLGQNSLLELYPHEISSHPTIYLTTLSIFSHFSPYKVPILSSSLYSNKASNLLLAYYQQIKGVRNQWQRRRLHSLRHHLPPPPWWVHGGPP